MRPTAWIVYLLAAAAQVFAKEAVAQRDSGLAPRSPNPGLARRYLGFCEAGYGMCYGFDFLDNAGDYLYWEWCCPLTSSCSNQYMWVCVDQQNAEVTKRVTVGVTSLPASAAPTELSNATRTGNPAPEAKTDKPTAGASGTDKPTSTAEATGESKDSSGTAVAAAGGLVAAFAAGVGVLLALF